MGYLDGLGDLQTQHSCVLLIDVTETCNLECPTCFAVSAPGVGRHARLPHVLRTLDAAIEREGGQIDALMLSGGEPTVHPGIVDLIRGGGRAQRDPRGPQHQRHPDRPRRRVPRRAGAALRDRVEVYLQFDGFRGSTYLWHRGEDLRAVKDAAIRRLTDARIFTTLAVAVAKGVNEDEVGAIVDYALRHRLPRGRRHPADVHGGPGERDRPDGPRDHDRHDRAGSASRPTAGSSPDDFIALPCCHPDCASLTYFVRRDDGSYRSVVADDRARPAQGADGLFGNRLAPDDALWEALTGLMSETAMVSRPELIDHLLDICEVCDLGVSGFVKTLGRWVMDRGRRAGRDDRQAGQAGLASRRSWTPGR